MNTKISKQKGMCILFLWTFGKLEVLLSLFLIHSATPLRSTVATIICLVCSPLQSTALTIPINSCITFADSILTQCQTCVTPIHIIHTYIIGHYNPSLRIMDLVSHTTYVVSVNFIHKWRDLQSALPYAKFSLFSKFFEMRKSFL